MVRYPLLNWANCFNFLVDDWQMTVDKKVYSGFTKGHGAGHWKGQRLSAIALIFFCGWFLFEIITHTQSDYHTVLLWASQPWTSAALFIFVGLLFYHSALGLQVIIEDYVSYSTQQRILIFIIKVASLILTIISWFFLMRIAMIANS
jgi:succinate dehydrogenase / fumarate reductase, membrane anchor subunit